MTDKTLDEIYDEVWFRHDFEGLQPEFDLVANGIAREFDNSQCRPIVLDVGCGPGMLLSRLSAIGWEVHGYDGSQHSLVMAPSNVKDSITIADIVYMRPGEWGLCHHDTFDVAICTEVAEHLDEEDAPKLVKLLASAMCPVVFTAAPPGQDGHHHVNCQLPLYWHELFLAEGMIVDDITTTRLRLRWSSLKRLSHMTRNVMVFR